MPKITKVPLQVLLSTCLYLGQMGIGFSLSWSGPNISKLQDIKESPLPYVLTDTQVSLVASFIYVGCVPGTYIMGWLSNTIGRKPCLLLGGGAGVIGYILLATSRTMAMIYLGRCVIGLSIGSLAVMILVYVGEIASTNIRGILLTVVGLFNACGSVLLFSVGSFLSYHASVYVGLALFTIFTLCVLMIPETPIYHALKGNDDAMKQILQDLGRLDEVEKLIHSQKEFKTRSNTKDWKDLISQRSNKKALFIVVSINVLNQCSGMMAVVFFSSIIFKNAGSSIDGNIAMLIITCCELLGSALTPIFIERIGRKSMLNVSCILCSLTMFLMGLYFYLVHIKNPIVNNIKWLPLVILLVFFIAFDSGFGIIPHVLIGEMFTPNARSNGSALTINISWVMGFVINTVFGSIVTKVGIYVPFWFFATTCALAYFFSVFFIPETKGKALMEIQKDLDKK